MELFHVTSQQKARLIQRRNFMNGFGSYGVRSTKTSKLKTSEGVFLADCILDSNEGLPIENPAIFVLNIPEEIIKEYEWHEDKKGYREWCVPAEIVNKYFVDRKIYSEDDVEELRYGK